VQDEDPLADLGLEEIKAQNKQLRQAIVSQKYMYEEEKKTLEAQFKADNTKDLKIADLEQRLSEMDFLLDEADKLETEKADLQEKLESMNEYEKMVEEMVEEIARKDDEQEDFVAKHAELQEEARLMEELSNQMETYNKELQQEIDERNQQVDGLKEEVEQLNFIIIE
jgi:chromosome segregation ATPase